MKKKVYDYTSGTNLFTAACKFVRNMGQELDKAYGREWGRKMAFTVIGDNSGFYIARRKSWYVVIERVDQAILPGDDYLTLVHSIGWMKK